MRKPLTMEQIKELNGCKVIIDTEFTNTLKLTPLDETKKVIEVEATLEGDDDGGYWPELKYNISED